MQKTLLTVSRYSIQFSALILFFLFPIFFLFNVQNPYDTNKLALLIIAMVISLIFWAIRLISQKHLRLTITPFTYPLLAIAASTLLSTFIAATSPTESLLGRSSLLLALVFLSFSLTSNLKGKKIASQALYAFIASGAILSFVAIFQSLGFGLSTILNKLLNLNIPNNLSFTPIGSPLSLLSYLCPILIISVIWAFYKKEMLEKVVLFILSAVITSATVLTLIYSLPGKDTSPVILPIKYGYFIAVETLKNPKTALLGFGPEQFINAYNSARPAGINLTNLWNIRFTGSSTELLTLITTQGLIGLAAWVFLCVTLIKSIKTPLVKFEAKLIRFITLSLFFLQLLIPGGYILLALSYFMLTLYALSLKAANDINVKDIDIKLKSINYLKPSDPTIPDETPIVPILGSLPLIAVIALTLFFGYKAYAAEIFFKNSLDAAGKNDGTGTYNLQRQAILTNPLVSQYRRSYSATNLALANTISSKGNLSQQDKANVTQLIQQSIREAKAAVTIDPKNTANWESLNFVYRNLINVAQNADQWTVSSFAQSIQTDPINPRLRLELGGIYYSVGNYDQAIRLFQQAVELKPDWANAYYNLSSAHKAKNEFKSAYEYMRQVVSLVKPDTADYTKSQQELADLAEKANIKADSASPSAEPQTNLNPPPTPFPSPKPGAANTQYKLEQGSGPETVGADIPTPTPLPSPQP